MTSERNMKRAYLVMPGYTTRSDVRLVAEALDAEYERGLEMGQELANGGGYWLCQKQEVAPLMRLLEELHAVVRGECPSLLREDSGGICLGYEIPKLLAKLKGGSDGE